MLTKEEDKGVLLGEAQEAARLRKEACKSYSTILIECASKVLVDGVYPDGEFCARLYSTLTYIISCCVKAIYVLESFHRKAVLPTCAPKYSLQVLFGGARDSFGHELWQPRPPHKRNFWS